MSDRLNILLLEDDANLGAVLSEHLQMHNFAVTLCTDGEQGLAAWRPGAFDLCLVDIMMPKRDGFSFVEAVRRQDETIPLIFLTARSLKEDKIRGFKLGCDDYITKPFSAEELLLRIEALLRRARSGSANSTEIESFQIGSYVFDSNRRLLTLGDKTQKLTPRESDLLCLFCQNANRTVLREEALRKIWSDDSYFAGRSMDVFVSRLRKCLKDDPSIEIMSVHGKGFRLVVSK